jgi:hypothetical protein
LIYLYVNEKNEINIKRKDIQIRPSASQKWSGRAIASFNFVAIEMMHISNYPNLGTIASQYTVDSFANNPFANLYVFGALTVSSLFGAVVAAKVIPRAMAVATNRIYLKNPDDYELG